MVHVEELSYDSLNHCIGKVAKDILEEWVEYEREIVEQVRGYLVITYKLDLTKDTENILNVAIASATHDEWALEHEERRVEMDRFIQNINSYIKGNSVIIKEEGLFEKIINGME